MSEAKSHIKEGQLEDRLTAAFDELTSLLADMIPASRQREVGRLLSLVQSADCNGRDASQSPDMGPEGPEVASLTLCDWGADEGLDVGSQRLKISMSPGPVRVPKTRAATGRSLLSNGFLGADILHLPAGEGFTPHTHPGDHLLFVLGGKGTITVDGVITATDAGQGYLIAGGVPHAVGAITPHVILSVGAPHRALESVGRQQLVPYSAVMASMGTITCGICGRTSDSGQALADQGCSHSRHLIG